MGRDKGAMEVEGETLLMRIGHRLEEATDEVLVAGGAPKGEPWPRFADHRTGCGPLAGIETGLAAMRGEWGCFVASDMPHLQVDLVVGLLEAARSGEDDAVVLIDDSGVHPLLAAYSSACLPVVRQCLDEGLRRADAFHDRVRTRAWRKTEWRHLDPQGLSSTNWNRPADLPT